VERLKYHAGVKKWWWNDEVTEAVKDKKTLYTNYTDTTSI